MDIQTKDWHATSEKTAGGTKTNVFGTVVVPTSSTTVTLAPHTGIGPRDNSLQLEILLQDNGTGLQALTEKTVTYSESYSRDSAPTVRIFYKDTEVADFIVE